MYHIIIVNMSIELDILAIIIIAVTVVIKFKQSMRTIKYYIMLYSVKLL